MRNKLLISCVLILAVIAVGISAVSAARPPRPDAGGMHRPGGPLARLIMAQKGRMTTLLAELDLTQEQGNAIRQTLLSHKQELARAIKPAIESRRALRDAVLKENPDDAAIRSAAEQVGKAIGDAAVVIAKVKAEVVQKANLTPEQKEKIGQFLESTDASVDAFLSKVSEP